MYLYTFTPLHKNAFKIKSWNILNYGNSMESNALSLSLSGLNRAVLILSICLLGTIIGLVFAIVSIFNQHSIVTVTPPGLLTKEWISINNASAEYKKRWGAFVASTVGNTSPSNIDYMLTSLEELLTKEAFIPLRDQLLREALNIKDDSIRTYFSPEELIFEQSTNTVFVYGKTSVIGVTAKSDIYRTFEMNVDIVNYLPIVTFFNIYNGKPHTEQWKKSNSQEKRS